MGGRFTYRPLSALSFYTVYNSYVPALNNTSDLPKILPSIADNIFFTMTYSFHLATYLIVPLCMTLFILYSLAQFFVKALAM